MINFIYREKISIIFFCIFFFFFTLTKNNFFHWDTWEVLASMKNGLWYALTHPISEHFVPLQVIHLYLLIKFFGLNHIPLQLTLILSHLLNSLILYQIVILETRKQKLAICALILFAISSTYVENIFWSQIMSIQAGTLFFLAYYIYVKYKHNSKKNYIFWIFFLSILAPFYNSIAILTPFTFVFLFFLNKSFRKYSLLFLLGQALVILVTIIFSQDKFFRFVEIDNINDILLTFKFAFLGIFKGVFQSFFIPRMYAFVGSQSNFGTIVRPILPNLLIICTTAILIYVLKSKPFKFTNTINHLKLFISYIFIIALPYFATSLVRGNFGTEAANNSRYAYLSFFFFLLLLSQVVVLLKISSVKIYITTCFLMIVHSLSIINYANNYWLPLVKHDKNFSEDLAYLFNKNTTIYNLSASGINPNITIGDLTHLYPQSIVTVINNKTENIVTHDSHTNKIYEKIINTYSQKKD